jgi:choline-sulfatase
MGNSMKKPNMLIIMADQMTPFTLGAYGHPCAKTPHIDRLAAQGTLFDSAYCNSPLCTPSRASLLSGRLVSDIRCYDNASEFPSQYPTFVHHFRNAGYRTAASGKMHFVGADQLHGWEERLTTDIYPANMEWIPDWTKPISENPGSSIRKRINTATPDPHGFNIQTLYDSEVQHNAVDWLRRHKGGNYKDPFLFCVSFTLPHDPYTTPKTYWDRYQDAEIPLPEKAVPFGEMDKPDQEMQIYHGLDGTTPPDDKIRSFRRSYLANCSLIDDYVGQLMNVLEETGQIKNTIIVFTSDHGDMLGERGMWSKRNFYEWSVRVPLVIKSMNTRPHRIKSPVSLADLFPTLLDLAGLPKADHDLAGTSLQSCIQSGQADPAHAVISENLAEGTTVPQRMIRINNHKLIYIHKQAPKLYDLDTDPKESTNLADKPDYQQIKNTLLEELLRDWDPDAMERDVIASQKERRLIRSANTHGPYPAWDYNPSRESLKYCRDNRTLPEYINK